MSCLDCKRPRPSSREVAMVQLRVRGGKDVAYVDVDGHKSSNRPTTRPVVRAGMTTHQVRRRPRISPRPLNAKSKSANALGTMRLALDRSRRRARCGLKCAAQGDSLCGDNDGVEYGVGVRRVRHRHIGLVRWRPVISLYRASNSGVASGYRDVGGSAQVVGPNA